MFDDCTVCGRPVLVTINRRSGVCSEKCRKKLAREGESHNVNTSATTAQDMVNHPPHYTGHPKAIECIDVIEDNPFSNLSAAMKYLWRVSWGSKGRDIEDLEKADWYVKREISRREKGRDNAKSAKDLS